MDRKLAKILKGRGFPKRIILGCEGYPEYSYPTLEDLIEACGDRLVGMSRYKNGVFIGGWVVLFTANDVDSFSSEIKATTLIEAIARVWLALNKKEDKLDEDKLPEIDRTQLVPFKTLKKK